MKFGDPDIDKQKRQKYTVFACVAQKGLTYGHPYLLYNCRVSFENQQITRMTISTAVCCCKEQYMYHKVQPFRKPLLI